MAETKSLSQFKSRLAGGGARPNLFEVSIPSFPSAISEAWGSGDQSENGTFKFLCKAAALPASNTPSIPVPFRGRQLKVAGDRTFDTWTVTVINDIDFRIRTAMESWMQTIGQYSDGSGATDPADYQVDAVVKQFTRAASALSSVEGAGMEVAKQYKFYSIFPTNISAIDLSYDSADTIEEFTIEFQVQYWSPMTGEN